MTHERPDPDVLLARVQAEEAEQQRGKLKIFFGATAGVGKTYTMLEIAHERCAEGVDVVVGWVDTHGRAETAALLQGFEVLPRRVLDYRGTALHEFDLDAALQRHPTLLLVDELAHSNIPGSRHAKRWQDVEELLHAGIDVYTTMNVQHLESLNDIVAQITGVVIRETVPDVVLERADEVELVDLSPDDLLQRLHEGKVYMPQQAERALRHFFQKGNLIALRELALRRTAECVDDQMQAYRRDHAIAETWPTTERLLVCISPSPMAARLVRATRRMAARLRAEWIVAYVETPGHLRLPEVDRQRVLHTLRLAAQLGAETVTLSGQHVSAELIAYARQRNVSKIVVGKPRRYSWREVLCGSAVDALVRHSGNIDVYVISSGQSETPPAATHTFDSSSAMAGYAWGAGIVSLCTVFAWLLFPHLAEANLIMLYLLGVVIIAMRWGRGPSILASVLSVAMFDFFFVLPYLSFTVANIEYLLTFTVMMLVGVIISSLTVRLWQQGEAARQRERRTAALYALSRDLASARDTGSALQAATQHMSGVFESQVLLAVPDGHGMLRPHRAPVRPGDTTVPFSFDAREQGVAQWVYEHRQMAGLGTDTLPSAQALYLPLIAAQGTMGVLGIRPAELHYFLVPEHMRLLETFASQTALAIERAKLTDEAHGAQLQVEAEQLRNVLLSSVSHDLRTPLASITGAASTLLDSDTVLDVPRRLDLLQTIYEEADRLNRLVHNLLEMTRLESGALHVQKEWQPLEEVIGAALTRLETRLRDRSLTTQVPPDLPLVPLDSVLIEQVLINLLDNALKYTPAGSPLALSAWASEQTMTLEVVDQGPGLDPGDEQRVFEKFSQAKRAGGTAGFGLGLAICRGIVEAHGGRIWAENQPGGGVAFRFTLPLDGTPPPVMLETGPSPTP